MVEQSVNYKVLLVIKPPPLLPGVTWAVPTRRMHRCGQPIPG